MTSSIEPKVFAFVFARGGSKGVPDKNIRELAGKPLIGWSINLAQGLSCIHSIWVSTDSAKIATVAKHHGANVIVRPDILASDTASEWDAWKHAVRYLIEQEIASEEDVFLSLPATSPLRTKDDIQRALTQFSDSNSDILVTGMPSNRSPYFNMLKQEKEGEFGVVLPSSAIRRQDVPLTYDMTTVCYICHFDYILNRQGVLDGKVDLLEVDHISAIDIDTEFDFKLAQLLFEEYRKHEICD